MNFSMIFARVNYSLSSIFLVLALCWLSLYHLNFGYHVWHEYGGIKETINAYGGKNKHKQGFENTTAEQRNQAFWQINQAVHYAPETLTDIFYASSPHHQEQLLHEREIVHLQDVANLIVKLYGFIAISLLLYLASIGYLFNKKSHLPSIKQQLFVNGLIIALITLVIVVIGPTEVFYWFHTVVFPENHQWFFYYQDSLMSTLMAAPTLFGWIAVSWLGLFVIYYPLFQYSVGKMFNRAINTKSPE